MKPKSMSDNPEKVAESNIENIEGENSTIGENRKRTEQEKNRITNTVTTDSVEELRLKRGQTYQKNYNTTAYTNLKYAIKTLPKLEEIENYLAEDKELMRTLSAQYQRIARSYFEQVNVKDHGNANARLLKMHALRGVMDSIANNTALKYSDVEIVSKSHNELKTDIQKYNYLSEESRDDDNSEMKKLPSPSMLYPNTSYKALYPLLEKYQQRDKEFYKHKYQLEKIKEDISGDLDTLNAKKNSLLVKISFLENKINNIPNMSNDDRKKSDDMLKEHASLRQNLNYMENHIKDTQKQSLALGKVLANQPVNIDDISDFGKGTAKRYNNSLPQVTKAINDRETAKQLIKDKAGITRVESLMELKELINGYKLSNTPFNEIIEKYKLNDKRSHWSLNNTTTYNNLKTPLNDYLTNPNDDNNKKQLITAIDNDIKRLAGISKDKNINDINDNACQAYKNAVKKIEAIDKLIADIANGRDSNMIGKKTPSPITEEHFAVLSYRHESIAEPFEDLSYESISSFMG